MSLPDRLDLKSDERRLTLDGEKYPIYDAGNGSWEGIAYTEEFAAEMVRRWNDHEKLVRALEIAVNAIEVATHLGAARSEGLVAAHQIALAALKEKE